jgi:hypothetical protein
MSSEREDRCRFGNRFLCSMLLVRLLVHIASINAWHRLKVATRRLSWGEENCRPMGERRTDTQTLSMCPVRVLNDSHTNIEKVDTRKRRFSAELSLCSVSLCKTVTATNSYRVSNRKDPLTVPNVPNNAWLSLSTSGSAANPRSYWPP